MTEEAAASKARVRVWDAPVRLGHWSLVLLFAISWWTAETGRMDWHQYSGFAMFALVVFRIFWGFFGSSTARFSQFVRGPRAIASYLRGRWSPLPGHNPLGALSVIALLAFMFTQILLGLFAVDVDGIESGPLSTFVSFDAGRLAAKWHHRIFDALLWLSVLHILAVLFYVLYKKENLLGAMVHGQREYAEPLAPVAPVSKVRFAVGVLLVGVLTFLVMRAFQI